MAFLGTGANQVPPGGVPRDWIARTRPDIADLADRYADRFGVPRQTVYNVVWRENGTGAGTGNERLNITRSSAGAEGPMQMIEGTRRAYGITASSPLEDQMRAGINYLADLGYNRGYGHTNREPERSYFDPAAAVGGYIASPTRYYDITHGVAVPAFGNVSQAYVLHTTQGVVPLDSLPQFFRDLPAAQQFRQSAGFPTFDEAGWIASDPGWTTHDVSPGLTPTELDLRPPAPIYDFSQPLPFADTGLQGQSLQDWIASPTGGQRVAGLSEQGGYTLTPDVIEFVGRVAPELGGGPQAFPEGNFPWFTPGRIGQEEGAFLQHHALMPNNLVFDSEALNWRVPDPQRGDPQRFPGATGIWGAQTVADWLPGAATGFGRDYLTHLGYGAEHNAGDCRTLITALPTCTVRRARACWPTILVRHPASARSAWAIRHRQHCRHVDVRASAV